MSTQYVYIQWPGRLANQLICYCRGRELIENMPDKTLLINYGELKQNCILPRAEFRGDRSGYDGWEGPMDWPVLRKDEDVASCQRDCVWDGAWHMRGDEAIEKYLPEIQFKAEIMEMVNGMIKNGPFIGVHIRYGDHVPVDYMKLPIVFPDFPRATNEYYASGTRKARLLLADHEVFLASDGTEEELSWFTDEFHPYRQFKNDGLLDLLTLSRCSFIVGSQSTFSSVAATLGKVHRICPMMYPSEWTEMLYKAWRRRT